MLRKRCLSPIYGSIHFPFALSAAHSAVYRRDERKTLTTNGLNQRFPNSKFYNKEGSPRGLLFCFSVVNQGLLIYQVQSILNREGV